MKVSEINNDGTLGKGPVLPFNLAKIAFEKYFLRKVKTGSLVHWCDAADLLQLYLFLDNKRHLPLIKVRKKTSSGLNRKSPRFHLVCKQEKPSYTL